MAGGPRAVRLRARQQGAAHVSKIDPTAMHVERELARAYKQGWTNGAWIATGTAIFVIAHIAAVVLWYLT